MISFRKFFRMRVRREVKDEKGKKRWKTGRKEEESWEKGEREEKKTKGTINRRILGKENEMESKKR